MELDPAARNEPSAAASDTLGEAGALADREPIPTPRIDCPGMADPLRWIVRRDEASGRASAVWKRTRETHGEPDEAIGFFPRDLVGPAGRALHGLVGRKR